MHGLVRLLSGFAETLDGADRESALIEVSKDHVRHATKETETEKPQ